LESARLIKEKISTIAYGQPQILMGDFNCTPDEAPYKHLTIQNSESISLYDAKEISQTEHYGPKGTFTGFNIKTYSNQPIDYIFCGKGIKVIKHATLSDSFDGRLPSDHFPIIVEIKF
jgi:endonuclease/exonuclease/phosphatase family metal-dependent hydrolase